jgi:multisubunit Na+/H+ antiporter MnhB subunit
MTKPAPPRLPRWTPIALVAAACLALALTAHPLISMWPKQPLGPLRDYRPITAIVAAVLLGGLVTRIAPYRDGRDGLLVRAAQACVVLIGVAAVATPIALIVMRRPTPPPQNQSVVPQPSPLPSLSPSAMPTPTHTQPPAEPSHDYTWILEIVLAVAVALVLVAAVVAVVLFLLRLWRSQAGGSRQNVGEIPFGTLEDAEDLADAVEAAAAALDRGEAREAVIACYATMERSMQASGVRRRTSDSPEELLINAARVGFVRGTAGRRLTDLFREARFSAHAIDEAKRTAARGTLLEIAADLREVMAEKKAQAEETARLAALRDAEKARTAEAHQTMTESKRGTHR